jgi:hypothetical protein
MISAHSIPHLDRDFSSCPEVSLPKRTQRPSRSLVAIKQCLWSAPFTWQKLPRLEASTKSCFAAFSRIERLNMIRLEQSLITNHVSATTAHHLLTVSI